MAGTVGGGTPGRKILLKMAGEPIAGVQTKGYTIANDPIDVSDDSSSGFRELLAEAGQEALDVSISGVTKSLSLLRSNLENESKVYTLEFEYPDGSKIDLYGFLESYDATGDYNGAETFDASFQSTGQFSFTEAPPA